MSERAVIIAPFRSDGGERERVWTTLVGPYYQSSGLEVFEGDVPGPFNISAVNNYLADEAGDWDVAMFIGADIVIPLDNMHRGIEYAREHQVMTLPHDEFYALTKEGGRRCGRALPFQNETKWRMWSKLPFPGDLQSKLYAPSGVLAMPRSVWERIGGYDEELGGWGFEDHALLLAAGEFHRLSGRMYHFWHPTRYYDVWPSAKEHFNAVYKGRTAHQYLVDEDRWLS